MSLFSLGALFKTTLASIWNGNAFPGTHQLSFGFCPGVAESNCAPGGTHGHVAMAPSINHPCVSGYLSGCPNPCQLTDASLLESCRRRCYRRHREQGWGHARHSGNYRNASPGRPRVWWGRLARQANPRGGTRAAPRPCHVFNLNDTQSSGNINYHHFLVAEPRVLSARQGALSPPPASTRASRRHRAALRSHMPVYRAVNHGWRRYHTEILLNIPGCCRKGGAAKAP